MLSLNQMNSKFTKRERVTYMKIHEYDVIDCIIKEGYENQRIIAEITNYSLGKVNEAINKLIDKQYLNQEFLLTEKAHREINIKRPKNAIILAAGFGMRMIPINQEVPKGLLSVHAELLIDRIITQLHEVGIYDIDIVVGFMKEKYEYLIDKYGVNLVYNGEYALKNNIHSLNLVAHKISNTYIIPCDIYCSHNPFSDQELYSWYSVSDVIDDESIVRINRQRELVPIEAGKGGNGMIGISYLLEDEASVIRHRIKIFCKDKRYNDSFWEEAIFDPREKINIYARVYNSNEVFEIDTYEQLKEIDNQSSNLNSSIISLMAKELGVKPQEIREISVLKKGMTNRSFLFSTQGKQYIMRIPGEGTDQLINRQEEYNVYQVLEGADISDRIIYMSADKGYKITEFWNAARTCDPFNMEDVSLCMNKLRSFHNLKLTVPHEFDLFGKVEFYESLWEGKLSIFDDYAETKRKIMSLQPLIESLPREWVLSHIDSVPDNFLFVDDDLYLIDWEYAAMQDPHLDIAMFAIYALYDRAHTDLLIGSYFTEGCPAQTRMKIYAYMAVGGLLWSNWCEYKRFSGVEFGEYSLRQYRYAKDYYKIVQEERAKINPAKRKGM